MFPDTKDRRSRAQAMSERYEQLLWGDTLPMLRPVMYGAGDARALIDARERQAAAHMQ